MNLLINGVVSSLLALLHPVTMDDLLRVQGSGLGWFHEVVGDLHARLSDFIHRIVVHRRDEAFRSWRGWLREDPLVRPYRWVASRFGSSLSLFAV